MACVLIKRIFKNKNYKDDAIIIYLYRYFSLLISSMFYLIGGVGHSTKYKVIGIVCLCIASILMNNLYIENRNNEVTIIMLVTIDTLSNIGVLIPTGGLSSPYIWYSFNTILITISYLNIYYCISNLSFYIVLSLEIPSLVFENKLMSIQEAFNKNYNFILAYILITVVTNELFILLKKLTIERHNLILAYEEVNSAHSRIKDDMNNMMSLYKTVNYLINENDRKKVARIIVDHSRVILKTDNVFLNLCLGENTSFIEYNGEDPRKYNVEAIIKEKTEEIKKDKLIWFTVENKRYICVLITSSQKEFGVLGFTISNENNDIILRQYDDHAKFLAELSSIVFERMNLEEVNKNLVISDEKNRIANEIHDSVSQKLFAASCSIHNIKKKLYDLKKPEVINDLDETRAILMKSIQELRETIYGLSWNKNGENSFVHDVENYISDISKIRNIKIIFNINGNSDYMNISTKKAIYRIICEGTNNAVRHSKCNSIIIKLNILQDTNELIISDDGIGFQIATELKNKEGGLGINNIFNLVNLHGGNINIDSNNGKGTRIFAILPNCLDKAQREEAI